MDNNDNLLSVQDLKVYFQVDGTLSQAVDGVSYDIGKGETKTSVAGLAEYYEPQELTGKKVAVICNLKTKKIAGVTSEVMIMAAVPKEASISLLVPDGDVEIGTKIC